MREVRGRRGRGERGAVSRFPEAPLFPSTPHAHVRIAGGVVRGTRATEGSRETGTPLPSPLAPRNLAFTAEPPGRIAYRTCVPPWPPASSPATSLEPFRSSRRAPPHATPRARLALHCHIGGRPA